MSAEPDLVAALREKAAALGFDAVAIAPPDLPPETGARLRDFLVQGFHGDMGWLADRPERRESPRGLWADVRAVVMLGVNYGPAEDPRTLQAQKDHAAISVYARGDDYHDVIKPRLKELARWLIGTAGGDAKVFVDTAAVMEKPLAMRAGLGWQGKHTNLVSKDLGSWLFLGALFTTLPLPPDPPGRDRCGSCRACLDACPTNAFPAPYRLDPRRCVSYLTIEHKGSIPRDLRAPIGNRVYGCDDCLAACPWNKFARMGHDAKLSARDELTGPALAELASLDDAAFRALFRKTAVKRVGREKFMRNVMIAIGNSGDPSLVPAAEARLLDSSALVRGAAVWALSKLLPERDLSALAERHRGENDPDVRDEWRAALRSDEG